VERELEECCVDCGYPTIEAKFEFRGEMLAVCACTNPKCNSFNWILPQGAVDDKGEETPIYYESEAWARERAEEMKREYLNRKPELYWRAVADDVIERYLDSLDVLPKTRDIYKNIIKRFLVWLMTKGD